MAFQIVWMSGSGKPHYGEGSLCVSYESGSSENLTFSGSNINMTMKSGSEFVIGEEKTAKPFYRFSHDGDISFSKAGTDKETVLRLKNEKLEVKQRNKSNESTTETGHSNLIPEADDSYDIGSSTVKWKDLYVDGIAYLDGLNLKGSNITGATISGSFTSLSASIATDINNAGGGTVDTSLKNGSKNAVTNDAVYDEFQKKLNLTGGTMEGLIQPIVQPVSEAPKNNTVDVQKTNVVEVSSKKAITIDFLTSAFKGQEITILNIGSATVTLTRSTNPKKDSVYGAKNLTISTGTAYKFVIDSNAVWYLIGG